MISGLESKYPFTLNKVKAQTIDNLIKNLKSKVPEEVLDQFENELT
jgi:hypothetical protein